MKAQIKFEIAVVQRTWRDNSLFQIAISASVILFTLAIVGDIFIR